MLLTLIIAHNHEINMIVSPIFHIHSLNKHYLNACPKPATSLGTKKHTLISFALVSIYYPVQYLASSSHPLLILSYFLLSFLELQVLSQILGPSKSQMSFYPDSTFFILGVYLRPKKKKIFLLLTWWLNFNALFCLKNLFLLGVNTERGQWE